MVRPFKKLVEVLINANWYPITPSRREMRDSAEELAQHDQLISHAIHEKLSKDFNSNSSVCLTDMFENILIVQRDNNSSSTAW